MWREVWRAEYEADENGPAGVKIGFSNGLHVKPVFFYQDGENWYYEHDDGSGRKGSGSSLSDCIYRMKKGLAKTYYPYR